MEMPTKVQRSPKEYSQTSAVVESQTAQQNSPLDRDKYCCSICLDLLRNPGTLPCGHSYCLGCITEHWDKEDVRGVYSCPQCRRTFAPRPALVKTTVLADVMEDLKRTRLRDAPPDHCYAGPEDVGCDVCTGRKMKAIKSCLGCQASSCEEHLQSHYQVPGLKRHKLAEPTADLQDNICTLHDEVIKMFCCQDQQSICCDCAVDEHRDHDIIPIEAERNKRQQDLSRHQKTTRTRIQAVEKDLKVLHQEIDSINEPANVAFEDMNEYFAQMICHLERRDEIKGTITTKQKAAGDRLQEVRNNLADEVFMRKWSTDDFETLFQIHSDTTVVQKSPQDLSLKKYTGLPARDIDPLQFFKNVTEMKDEPNVFQQYEIPHISKVGTQADVLRSRKPVPKTRAGFIQYSCEMSFDPNTGNHPLSLSEGNRRFTLNNKMEPNGGHWLSKDSLTGRQYWEVKWTGRHVSIAVGYKDSSWNRQKFGKSDKSWALCIGPMDVQFKHNDDITLIAGRCPSRVGMYLDYRAGTLCFYNISDNMTLLHKVQTKFAQPLYASIWLLGRPGDSVEFCYPLQI